MWRSLVVAIAYYENNEMFDAAIFVLEYIVVLLVLQVLSELKSLIMIMKVVQKKV